MEERLARNIARLRRRSANVRMDELLRVWAGAGGTFRAPRGGSHYRLYLGGRVLSVPFRRPVLEVYVRQVLDAITEAFAEGTEEEAP